MSYGGFFMAKCKTVLPFQGTEDQEKKLKEIIDAHKHIRGALIPLLQQAQDLYGYLPIEVQTMIAEGLGVPLEEVYGVVTFYGQFNLYPKGRFKIAVCMGTACYVKGAGQLLEQITRRLNIAHGEVTPDGKFSLDATRCIGACGLAPVLTINEDVYGCVLQTEMDGILDKYMDYDAQDLNY